MKLQRSWKDTVFSAMGALALGVASVLLVKMAIENDGWKNFVGWPTGILSGFGALGCMYSVFFGSAKASCPSCGKPVALHDRSGKEEPFVPCAGCSRMIAVTQGEVTPVEEGHIAPFAGFRVPLPETFRWPQGCCVCGKPATRNLPASVHSSNTGANAAASTAGLALGGLIGIGFFRTGGGKTISVEVPHCDAHDDGAALQMGPDKEPQILFRSLPTLRAFCEINQLRPARH